MLTDLLALAYPSFGLKNLRSYFSTPYLIKGFLTALLLSLFIYLAYFGFKPTIYLKTLNSISALAGFYLLLGSRRQTLFWSGFFIGLFWFYWIGFSFRYYDMSYLIPLMMLFVSVGYGVIFWIVGLFRHPLMRALLFWLMSYFYPMNFNWFVPELTLIDSFFGIEKWQFGLFLSGIVLLLMPRKNVRWLAIIPLLLAIEWHPHPPLPLPKEKIYLSKITTPQATKWKDPFRAKTIRKNFREIEDAIDKGYDIIILHESAFATFLNTEPTLVQKLKMLSKKIAIVTGGLYFDGRDSYNSTYYFIDGEMKIANKVVLVPFGEEIPLPRFISRYINQLVFNGAEDYIGASRPTDVKINAHTFRNAICYEATREELFVKDPPYMIAISNNAWFTPSIEPTLQYLLLRYFSRRHRTVIFHCANMGRNAVIR